MVQVSSTGDLGFAVRSHERAYFSYENPVTMQNLGGFYTDLAEHLLRVGSEIEGTPITRSVMRTVIGESALNTLVDHPTFARYLEAAAPLPATVSGSNEYLVYFSRNATDRRLGTDTNKDFLGRVQKAHEVSLRPQKVEGLPEGFRFTTQVSDPDRLFALWGETFGWDREGCIDFAKRLEEDQQLSPAERRVWFKGIEDAQGILRACAMAERLDVPSSEGEVALIEHTEWATHPDVRGHGLGRQVVRSLTQDIKSDMQDVRHLVFAECNLTSGAHIVAAHAGFTVPRIDTLYGEVGQVLCNNVRVGDGLEPQGGYRNFMFTVA